LFVQAIGAGQVPQLMGGHPETVNVPQLSPAGHAVGQLVVHCVPVWLQELPAGHVPQKRVPPHWSGAVPQI
jgi:hypothetical protein